MERPQVSDTSLLKAIEALTVNLGLRIQEKGRGAFTSNHEMLGVITEEYMELIEAVKQNDPVAVANELTDIMVGCLFSISSLMEVEAQIKAAQAALEEEVSALTTPKK